jgi:hypothetical protein
METKHTIEQVKEELKRRFKSCMEANEKPLLQPVVCSKVSAKRDIYSGKCL